MNKKSDLAPETKMAQAMHHFDTATGGVAPPIQPSTTYVRDENHQLMVPAHSYSRDENPGYLVAAKMLTELKGATSALLPRFVGRMHSLGSKRFSLLRINL